MSISQVAREAGVRPSTLRYYEDIGLLPRPDRVSGRRSYNPDIMQRIVIIRTAQKAGFTLDELRVLFDDILPGSDAAGAKWNDLIQRKLHELDALMSNVQSMKKLLEDMQDCDDDELAECIYWTGQKYALLR
jgi:MerR family transcriptional regulator, redox-sensitive transcriptional activator SoxR